MPVSFKPKADDVTLIQGLKEKLGVGTSALLRMAIRALAKNHKITLKSA